MLRTIIFLSTQCYNLYNGEGGVVKMEFFIIFIGIIVVVSIISNVSKKSNESYEQIHELHSTNDLHGDHAHTTIQENHHCADNSSTTPDSSCGPSGD